VGAVGEKPMPPSDARSRENEQQTAAESPRRFIAIPIVLLSIYWFWVWRFWPFTIDDAYISARYARNLVRGYGLVYNPGERVMGYTNLSLTLIEAVVEQFGLDGVLAAKIIGVAAGAGVLGLTFLLARQVGGSVGAATLAVAFLSVYPSLAISAVMGIETTLFIFFFLMFLSLFLRFLDRPGGVAFSSFWLHRYGWQPSPVRKGWGLPFSPWPSPLPAFAPPVRMPSGGWDGGPSTA